MTKPPVSYSQVGSPKRSEAQNDHTNYEGSESKVDPQFSDLGDVRPISKGATTPKQSKVGFHKAD